MKKVTQFLLLMGSLSALSAIVVLWKTTTRPHQPRFFHGRAVIAQLQDLLSANLQFYAYQRNAKYRYMQTSIQIGAMFLANEYLQALKGKALDRDEITQRLNDATWSSVRFDAKNTTAADSTLYELNVHLCDVLLDGFYLLVTANCKIYLR